MGKKSYSKRPSGVARSLIKNFENTAGIEPKRVGGKKLREPRETILYTAPVSELVEDLPVITETLTVRKEVKPFFGEQFMRGFWNFVRGERSG